MDQVDIFLERIAALREAKGLTERKLSLTAGGADILRDVRRKRHMPAHETLRLLAAQLDVSIDYLAGATDLPATLKSDATIADRRVAWRDPSGRGDLPILGTALGADFFRDGETEVDIEQTIFEPGEVIRYLPRPSALSADPYAYALYIQGDSMSPRYEPGELAVATTRKPPQLNDDVIVQLTADAGEGDGDAPVISVLIKRLARRSASWVELRQFNPPATFRVPTERIRHIHRIVPIGDLLGA